MEKLYKIDMIIVAPGYPLSRSIKDLQFERSSVQVLVVVRGGARQNSIRVHYHVMCTNLAHHGALIIDYRGAQTDFLADYKVKKKAIRVHVHPVGTM